MLEKCLPALREEKLLLPKGYIYGFQNKCYFAKNKFTIKIKPGCCEYNGSAFILQENCYITLKNLENRSWYFIYLKIEDELSAKILISKSLNEYRRIGMLRYGTQQKSFPSGLIISYAMGK